MKKSLATLLVFLTLSGTPIISEGISYLVGEAVIRNTGAIIARTRGLAACESEIRGVFVHCATFSYGANWTLIAQTLAQYKITDVFVEIASYGGGYYDGSPYGDQLGMAISALHPKSIRVHAVMDVVYNNMDWDSSVKALDHTLTPVDWNDPANPTFINYVKQRVLEIASYDIDGFMFDYIRYDTADMSYSSYDKAQLETYLGQTIANWPGDFAPGGLRYGDFMEWRTRPITDLVTSIRGWLLPIRPGIEFSIACWTLFGDAPTYWRYWLGQDTAYWVSQDYLDFVAPMMYTTTLTGPDSIQDYVTNDQTYLVGGREGKVPLVAFITTGIGSPVAPSDFKAVVDKARSLGADGWIIWRYGGPGADPSVSPDIRNYLSLIDLPATFSISNVQASTTQTTATITWTTDQPATSKVEYSTSPLFSANYLLNGATNFHYWQVNHVNGTLFEDNTNVTSHTLTLTGLVPARTYYFRVESSDSGGTATTEVSTFATK